MRLRFTLFLIFLTSSLTTAATTSNSTARRMQTHVALAMEDGLTTSDFAHLFFSFAWRDTLPDQRQAMRSLEQLEKLRKIDPLMRAELALWRSRLVIDEGHPDEARVIFKSIGGLSQWWTAEPVVLGELEDFQERATYPPDNTEWRPVTGTDPLGWVRLAGLAWPARRQMLYLATTVNSPRVEEAAFSIGLAQVARLWLNGNEILTTPHPMDHREDQIVGGGALQQGQNLIVVAVASESDDWWLRLRLAAPDGSFFPDDIREIMTTPIPRQAETRTPSGLRSLESELRIAAERGKNDAPLALAAFLVARHPQPEGYGIARSACNAARDQEPALSRVLEWLITSEPTAARNLLEEALKEDSSLIWARIELARWYHQRGLYEQTRQLIDDSLSEAVIRAVNLDLNANRWGPLIIKDLQNIVEAEPYCVDASIILAKRAMDSHRWSLAHQTIAHLETYVPGLDRLRDLRQELASSCGDSAQLRTVLNERLDVDPNQIPTRLRLARLHVASLDPEKSRQLLIEGLIRCPNHPDIMLEMANLDHLEGNNVSTITLARKILDLRPQDQSAQRLLRLLGDQEEDQSWRRTVDELRSLALTSDHNAPAVGLINHVEIHFLPGNLTEELVQRAYLIRDKERANHLLTHPLPYVPERQRLRVFAARIVRADGSEISAHQRDTPRLSEPEFSIYYDTRLRLISFPEFEDGDLLEISYALTETAESNDTGSYKGDIVRLAQKVPVTLTEVEMSGPKDMLPSWELANLSGEPEIIEDADGTVNRRWSWRDLEASSTDQPSPPELLVSPHLVYSNHPSWGELADWYQRHIGTRIRASHQVKELAEKLTENTEGRLRRIARIYHFVTDEIRYVGLEFGEHRFRPFSADWVLNHRIGDCKDKAALLVALLESVNIPARMVMLRTADLGPIKTSLAILQNFNHAIVYLPDDDLWLDGTAVGHGAYPPPTIDQGALALVVDGKESQLKTIPILGGGAASYTYELRRSDDGDINLRVRTEDTGEAADMRRAIFAGSKDPQRYASWLQSQFPGARLIGEPILQLRPGTIPATMELNGTISPMAIVAAGGIPTFPGEFEWASQLAPNAKRSSPLLLPVRPDLRWTTTVKLGRPALHLPEDISLDTRFGSLNLKFMTIELGYEVTGFFHLEPGLIEASDAPDLRRFLVAVQRYLEQPLEAL